MTACATAITGYAVFGSVITVFAVRSGRRVRRIRSGQGHPLEQSATADPARSRTADAARSHAEEIVMGASWRPIPPIKIPKRPPA